jgi:hypothetical protein
MTINISTSRTINLGAAEERLHNWMEKHRLPGHLLERVRRSMQYYSARLIRRLFGTPLNHTKEEP